MTHSTPDEIVHKLERLGATLWRLLEMASDEARQWFDARGSKIEPCMFANIVRYVAHNLLEEEGYDLLDLGNNGIQIEYRDHSIKVLKADDGGLPVPGPSHTKQCFYEQTLMFNRTVDVMFPPHEYRNLVLCWEVDKDYSISHLTLYCPQAGNEHSARAYWSRPILHPGDSGVQETADISTGQSEFEDDLDIKALGTESAQTGTEQDD